MSVILIMYSILPKVSFLDSKVSILLLATKQIKAPEAIFASSSFAAG